MEEIIPILITIVVGLCCYLFQNIERVDYNKNFRYLWDLESINQTYLKLKSNEPEANLAKIHDAYVKSKQRLLNKSTLESKIKIYFYEIEHNFKRKRSIDALKKQVWCYAKNLAIICNYEEDEVENEDFDCVGWEKLWDLYWYHKDRILKKDNFEYQKSNNTKFDNNDRILGPDEYHTIFEDFEDPFSLYEKYLSLRQKNLDNPAGLNILNNLYKEALQRIYNEKYENWTTYQRQNYRDNINDPIKATTKEKNENLFKDINNLTDLKKKYHRLVKLNHPDLGGSNAKMKKLQELYEEAKNRIRNQQSYN